MFDVLIKFTRIEAKVYFINVSVTGNMPQITIKGTMVFTLHREQCGMRC